jgi:translation elongation factor aEF-1 beta
MAKIRIIYKIMPSDIEKKTLDNIVSKLKGMEKEMSFTLNDYRIEPIAFGLNALKVLFTVEEKSEGLLDRLEKKLNDMKEISSVEVIGMTRD